MADQVSAFPLAWPPGRPRTMALNRGKAKFRSQKGGQAHQGYERLTLEQARDRLDRELEALKATEIVLSTDIELRLNGQPRSGRPPPADPGVALYFRLMDRPVALACDRWETVAENVAAIAAHIGALRGQERWGVGTLDQAFAGFLALPAPASDPVLTNWRKLLGNPVDLAAAEATWKRLAKLAHEVGGANLHDRQVELNRAIAEARLHFKSRSAS